MPTCDGCGEYVTSDFIRVFGVNGEVNACPACSTYSELQEGEGAEPSE